MARAAKHAVEVHAVWDTEAEVWSAEAENLPGLVTEAETPEALIEQTSGHGSGVAVIQPGSGR